MPSVNLVRRWGSHEAGQTVDVDDTMAAWLTGNFYAEHPDRPGTSTAGVLAPGTDGPDQRAGGDISRPGRPQWQRSSRADGEPNEDGTQNQINRAARVPGAPRAFEQKVTPTTESDPAARKASGESPAEGTARHASGETPAKG